MEKNKKQMVTPTGTILYGHLKEKRKIGWDKRPIPEKDRCFEFILQIEKTHPSIKDFLAQLYNFAMQEYSYKPQVQEWISQGIGGGFAWKINDTDIMKSQCESKGDEFKDEPGCYHIRFKSKFPIMACDNKANQIPIDSIYDGCICDVSFNTSINGQDRHGSAGLYLNPQTIRFIANGTPRTKKTIETIEDQFANAPAPYVPEGVTVSEQPMPMQQQPMQQPMQPQPHNAILDAQPQQPMQQQPQQSDAYIDDSIPF